VLVIGSQSILGSYPEDELPPEATGSMEVDTAFFADPDGAKSDAAPGRHAQASRRRKSTSPAARAAAA
jgi:hypothetical protein